MCIINQNRMKKSILLFVMGIVLSNQTLFAQVPSYVPTNGLVAYYPFNGNANDASGNGNNGVNNGATLTTDRNGNANSAYYFSSSGCATRIDVDNLNYGSQLNSISISFWINRFGNGCLNPRIFEFGTDGFQIEWLNDSNTISSFPSINFQNNIWYNLVIVISDNTMTTYCNGILINTINNFGNISTLFGTDVAFGRMNHPGYDAFNGNLDDIGIWNRALTQQEITTLYNSVETPNYSDNCNNVSGSLTQGLVGYWPFCGNANDDSGHGNNGTVNGATLTTDRFGNANSAYSFDSNEDIIINQNFNFNSQDFSISVWCKLQTPFIYTTFNLVELGVLDNTTYGGFALRLDQNNNSYGNDMYQFYGLTSSDIHSPSYNFNSVNQWNNITITKNNEVYKLYLNGQLVATTNISGIIDYSNAVLQFGNKQNINNNIVGERILDDIGIWNRALTPAEVSQLYNQNQCFTNITVTDTLIINVGQLSFTNPVTYANNITIAPNPASTQITISFNNITDLTGGTINVVNALGQLVATTPITASGTNTSMALNTWGSNGMYYVQIVNANGVVVDVKKIILQ